MNLALYMSKRDLFGLYSNNTPDINEAVHIYDDSDSETANITASEPAEPQKYHKNGYYMLN